MSTFKGLFDIRDVKENDYNFIRASFLNGLYYGSSWFNLIPKDIFMANYKNIINGLLDHPGVTIKIACPKDEQDLIIGYSILSADYATVHWVFVKHKWRNNGVGKALLPTRPEAFSHLSDLGKILMSKYENTIFNPFAIN